MKTKAFKRIFALTLLLVLCLSLAPAAYADPTPSGTNAKSITKTITVPHGITCPTVTYTYEFTAATGNTATSPVMLGGGPSIGNVTIAFPTEATKTEGTPKDTYTAVKAITMPAGTQFPGPGVYRYTVEESPNGTVQGLEEGSPTSLTFDVYVGYAGGATTLSVLGAVLHKSEAATPESGNKVAGFTADYATNDLTITKTVTGSMGDRSKEFTFSVTITGPDNTVSFTVDYPTGQAAGTNHPTTINGSTATNISLKSGQSVTIKGLPASAGYSIAETGAPTEYTTSYKVNSGTATPGNTVSALTFPAATTIEFINNYDLAVPTGISMDMAPFAALILLAVLGLALPVLKKKKAQR